MGAEAGVRIFRITPTRRSFSARIAQLLARIDCRRADTGEQREAIFRLRYQAYLRDGSIFPNSSGSFSDPYDKAGNVYLFGLYIDDELAGSIRIHVGSRECPNFPSLDVFPDILQPELDAGKVIIDPTRFVTDENLARIYRGLPYAVARICGMAAQYFNADHLLAAVRVEHQAFYRRAFNHQVICEPRPYPHLAKPISLMTIHYPTVWPDAVRRYPFYGSTHAQRRMLFERAPLQAKWGGGERGGVGGWRRSATKTGGAGLSVGGLYVEKRLGRYSLFSHLGLCFRGVGGSAFYRGGRRNCCALALGLFVRYIFLTRFYMTGRKGQASWLLSSCLS